MKRFISVVVLGATLVVVTPAPAQAHVIYCAEYVGNDACFRAAAVHRCVHAVLDRVSHPRRVPPGVVRKCVKRVAAR